MANPVVYSIKEKVVYKVATSVKSAMINKHRLQGRDFQYLATYRLTGQTAPDAATILEEGVIIFQDHPEQEPIESDVNIDVYVYGNKEDDYTEFGKLIVWV